MALAEHMRAAHDAEGPKPTADGTRLRGSMAMQCSRRIGYQVLGEPDALEIEDTTLVAFEVGNIWHEVVQKSLVEVYGAATEVGCSYRSQGFDLSGSADAVYSFGMAKVCVEIKSMKAYAWGLATNGNSFHGVRSGPKVEHLVQVGLYALSPEINADIVHMIYINKDDGRMTEWMIPLDFDLACMNFPGQTIMSLVAAEVNRMQGILKQLDVGILPERFIPGVGLVETPPSRHQTKSNPWNCRYCQFQPVCEKEHTSQIRNYKVAS